MKVRHIVHIACILLYREEGVAYPYPSEIRIILYVCKNTLFLSRETVSIIHCVRMFVRR